LNDETGRGGETAVVTFAVTNPRRIDSRRVFALVDVEMEIAGVSFVIFGVQARKVPGGTSVHMPTFKDHDGSWRPALRLPEELRAPLADAVREFLVESGLDVRKRLDE
jgi:stage V sporulation protein G